jgi:hypothetical protein
MTGEMRRGELEDVIDFEDDFLPLGDGEMMMGIQKMTSSKTQKTWTYTTLRMCLAEDQSRSVVRGSELLKFIRRYLTRF